MGKEEGKENEDKEEEEDKKKDENKKNNDEKKQRGRQRQGGGGGGNYHPPTHLEVDILHVLHIKAHSSPSRGEVAIQLPPIVLYAAIGEAEPWVHLTSSSSKHSTLHVVVVLVVGEVVQDVAVWKKNEDQVKNECGEE